MASVMFNLSQSFGCTQHSQCTSASSSSLSSRSLQSPSPWTLKLLALHRRRARAMIGAPRLALTTTAPSPITASLGTDYLLHNWYQLIIFQLQNLLLRKHNEWTPISNWPCWPTIFVNRFKRTTSCRHDQIRSVISFARRRMGWCWVSIRSKDC